MTPEQLRLVYELANVGIITCDRAGVITHANQSAIKLFKRPLVGENLSVILPPYIREQHPALMQRFITSAESSKSMSARQVVKGVDIDNRELWLRIGLLKSCDQDGDLALTAIVEDTTDLIQAQTELRTSLEKQKILLNLLTDASYDYRFVDSGGIYITDKLKMMLGFEPEEMPNQYENFALWEERIHPEDREAAIAKLKTYLKTPSDKTHESRYRIRTKAGDYKQIESRGVGFWDDGKLLSFSGVIVDLTDAVEQVKQLQYLQKEQDKKLAAQEANSKRVRTAAMVALGAVVWFMITMKIDFEIGQGKPRFGVSSRDADAIANIIQLVPTGAGAAIAAWLFNKQKDG